MAARAEGTIEAEETSLKERFFHYFQHEITGTVHITRPSMLANSGRAALQEQMARLADTALIGGERSDASDHCLAGIARLSSEVKDASSYLPTYDQRTYAEVDSISGTYRALC
jgi:predicted component of type VI protein secretion system